LRDGRYIKRIAANAALCYRDRLSNRIPRLWDRHRSTDREIAPAIRQAFADATMIIQVNIRVMLHITRTNIPAGSPG
jgi:hypothetical protein